MQYKRKKHMFSILTILLVASSFMIKTEGLDDVGSIVIYSHSITPQGKRFLLEGDHFLVYQIAYQKDEILLSVNEFQTFEENVQSVDFMSLTTAKRLQNFVVKNEIVAHFEGITNQNGYLHFSNLKKGVYLIVQKEAFQYHGKEYYIDPFLISVPLDNKQDLMNIRIEPKYGWSRLVIPETLPKNPASLEEGRTSKTIITSDDTKTRQWSIYSIISLLVLIGLLIYEKKIFYRERKFQETSAFKV